MDRDHRHIQGFNHGVKRCITWLHARAESMNDPHAKALLHSAATNMGWSFSDADPDKIGRLEQAQLDGTP